MDKSRTLLPYALPHQAKYAFNIGNTLRFGFFAILMKIEQMAG